MKGRSLILCCLLLTAGAFAFWWASTREGRLGASSARIGGSGSDPGSDPGSGALVEEPAPPPEPLRGAARDQALVLVERLSEQTKTADAEKQIVDGLAAVGPAAITGIMDAVRQHEKPQWWATRATNALQAMGVDAAPRIADYLGDPHEEVRVVASVSLFFMARNDKTDVPYGLLLRAAEDPSQRVRYMAAMARRQLTGGFSHAEDVPADAALMGIDEKPR